MFYLFFSNVPFIVETVTETGDGAGTNTGTKAKPGHGIVNKITNLGGTAVGTGNVEKKLEF